MRTGPRLRRLIEPTPPRPCASVENWLESPRTEPTAGISLMKSRGEVTPSRASSAVENTSTGKALSSGVPRMREPVTTMVVSSSLIGPGSFTACSSTGSCTVSCAEARLGAKTPNPAASADQAQLWRKITLFILPLPHGHPLRAYRSFRFPLSVRKCQAFPQPLQY